MLNQTLNKIKNYFGGTMSKRVSIFELVEGKNYQAYNSRGDAKRVYQRRGDKLFNSDDVGGEFHGCSWVPVNAGWTFEETTHEVDSRMGVTANPNPKVVTVLGLREGVVYTGRIGGVDEKVIRIGSQLMFANQSNMPAALVQMIKIDMDEMFTEVASVPVDQVKAYWEAEGHAVSPV